MKSKALLFLLLWTCGSHCQPVFVPATSVYLDAAFCAPRFCDAFSAAINPAMLPALNGFSSAAYMEKKFMAEGLQFGAFAVSSASDAGGGGLWIKYFGNTSFNETMAGLHYAKSLGSINIAAGFRYHHYRLAGADAATMFTIALFSVWKLSDACETTVSVINPPFARIKNSTSMAAEYRVGFLYHDQSSVSIAVEMYAVERSPPAILTSLRYHFGKKYLAKAVIASAGPQLFFGLAWERGSWHTELNIGWHPALGPTPGSLLQYRSATADLVL